MNPTVVTIFCMLGFFIGSVIVIYLLNKRDNRKNK